MIGIYKSGDADARRIIAKQYPDQEEYETRVKEILAEVRQRGDAAVLEFTARFDGAILTEGTMRVTSEELDEAYRLVDEDFLAALRLAKQKIITFHAKQLNKSWIDTDEQGNILGQMLRPLARVGVYVPGGTACYPSSVLMNVLPATVAGVPEIVMVAPPTAEGTINPHTLVAAAEAGATEIYKIGGAQAVGALAFGTDTIKKVDLITGPGNIYVTLAKKQVYGQVNIDMLAGPSEILIIADETADPTYVAADLLSQAEHDVLAAAILITPVKDLAKKVQAEVNRQLSYLPRKEIITASLRDYSGIILTSDLEEAIDLANSYAPEHLELMVAEPFAKLGKVTNAGAIFLGSFSPEPLGDYMAGPNHILPTGGTARFYSPLNVDTFMKKSSLIYYTDQGLQKVGKEVVKLAQTEGLAAHANSVLVRLGKSGKEVNQ
ncbi:MAG: histidinol dehydrogenase [Carboxydocellales bacterium]